MCLAKHADTGQWQDWNKLEDKTEYNELAEKDKVHCSLCRRLPPCIHPVLLQARYEAEMKLYVPPANESGDDDGEPAKKRKPKKSSSSSSKQKQTTLDSFKVSPLV
jgi:hypothetical protein